MRKTFGEKINVLLFQTFDDFELLISDNGSTDQTQKICQKFIDKDARIKYFGHEKNSSQY